MRPSTSSNSLLNGKGRSAAVQRWQRSVAGNGRARARTRPSMLRAALASVSRPPSCVAASAIAGCPVCRLLTTTPITALACPHPTFARFPAISSPESRLRPLRRNSPAPPPRCPRQERLAFPSLCRSRGSDPQMAPSRATARGNGGQVVLGLIRGEYRDRHDVLFDAANPGNVLGGDAQRLPFCSGAGVRDPQMYDTVLHDNLFRPYPGPLPPVEFGQ